MMAFETIAQGSGSRIAGPYRVLVRTADEWRAVWAAHQGPDADPPAVDFTAAVVAGAVLGQRPSAGFGVEIAGQGDPSGVALSVIEHPPPPGGVAAQVLTSPFAFVLVPRSVGEVRWAEDRPAAASKPTLPPAPVASDAPSGTGLTPSTASTLAYLVGPLSGALVLLAEGRHEGVRFHAWQSILALGGLWVAGILCDVVAFGALFLSGAAGPVFLWISTLVWIVWVIVWLVCLWQTWAGARLELPYVGPLATRLARTPIRSSSPRWP